MRAIRLQTQIERDHTLRIVLPLDLAEGPAEVIVLVPDSTDQRARSRSAVLLEEILPLTEPVEGPRLEAIVGEIDEIYGQIRDLIQTRQGDPELKEAVRPLWQKLRKLQEQEADAMELSFREKILFDPRKGRDLLDQAQRILEKK
jgi:hypothetical protein